MAAQRSSPTGPSGGRPGAGPSGPGATSRSFGRRRKRYFVMMTVCVVLFVSAWTFIRLWSVPAAVALCVVALVIPPFAAIVGNRREPGERWWDEEDDGTGADGAAGAGPGGSGRPAPGAGRRRRPGDDPDQDRRAG